MSRRSSNSRTGPRAPSQRQLRVGESVRHALSELLARGDIHNDVIESNLITIPEVRMSPDLKLATVYVAPVVSQDTDDVVAALNASKKFIRREIAHTVQLKYAPELRFREDESFEEATRIDALLASPKVRRDTERD